MPPRRRAAAGGQATLSFGNQSRVTKPSSTPTAIHKAKILDSPAEVASPSGTPEPQQVLADAHPSKPHVAELVVREQAAAERKEPLSAEDERALKLSRKDLQSYWRKEEQKRRTPRVHQADLDLEEKILRHFDLSSQYGPCIGIARVKRWRRANMLKLNPPIEVLAVLLQDKNVKERAHMDELLS
ncbi:DNA polymerase delta subunit 4 [Penicillium rolfsii]|nr:DNA polymerase delta subunit 4 [Penicillium rolfsii]